MAPDGADGGGFDSGGGLLLAGMALAKIKGRLLVVLASR